MIKVIASVAASKRGNNYATDTAGNALIARTKQIGDSLKAGMYANVVLEKRTQRYKVDADGNPTTELEPIPESEQRELAVITAVFPDKDAALRASTGDKLFQMEEKLFVAKEAKAMATSYNVELPSFESLLA